MKKLQILAACLLAMMTTSCGEDWLAVESHDKLFIDDYYTTEARIYEALIASYQPMLWFDWNNEQYSPIPLVYDVMSDDIYPGGADMNDNRQYHLMFNFSAEPTNVCSSVWTVAYQGINRANCVHKYMPGVTDIDEDTKALYLAEATLLRNFYYSIVWKLWGNVPYYTTNVEGEPFTVPQATADQVYGNMVAELETLLDSQVLPMRVASTDIYGRVNQAMATMLYTEVVMYQNDDTRKQKALNYLEKVIESGQYSLYQDVANLFEPEAEWCEESIYEINYFSQGAYRSWGNVWVPGGTVLPRLIGINNLKSSSKFTNGWGFGPMTASAAALFTDDDKRKAATVYEPAKDGASYDPRYQDTGFFVAKYLPRLNGGEGAIADADLNWNNNIRIYRFAETLLYAAELLADGYTGNGTAQGYLDMVRQRAGLASVSASLENIKAERRLELMGEGKRYFDLVRWGDAESVLTPTNDAGGYRTKSWSASKKYLPIPQNEIDAAQGTLTQNNY